MGAILYSSAAHVVRFMDGILSGKHETKSKLLYVYVMIKKPHWKIS